VAKSKPEEPKAPDTLPKEEAEKEMTKKKQIRVSQSDCPLHTLEEALNIPKAIKEQYAGQATDPLLVATACGYSPSSSTWRTLTGAAIAYGLTEGGYNSKSISLTALGERIVSPLIEGDDATALQQAALIPSVLNMFFRQYDRNRFPREDIAKNVLASKSVPPERIDSVYKIIRENGRFTNTIQILSGSEYVRLSDVAINSSVGNIVAQEPEKIQPNHGADASDDFEIPRDLADRMHIITPEAHLQRTPEPPAIPKVFISHGKDSKVIVGQLKELLSYGQMEPVVSVENETTAVSVQEKVFDDMRSCNAGIIHVCAESVSDVDNHTFSKLNENVLIEIGAAMALYGKRIIILCRKGTQLPSNLQGLYRCEYDTDQLDYGATMKLLKTLQELRKLM